MVFHGAPQVGWWTGHANPTTGPTGTSTTWVGVKLRFTVPGRVFGLRMFDTTASSGSPGYTYGVLTSEFPQPGDRGGAVYQALSLSLALGFHNLWFGKPFRITVGDTYRLGVLYVGGGFYRTNSALASAVTRNGITFVSSFQLTTLDLANATTTDNTNANAVDVLFLPD
jgi:hypothetical protein